MKKGIFAFCTMVAILGYSLSPITTSAGSPKFYVADEISIDGPALFYGVNGDVREELWSVFCTQPLRSCVARAPGLVLSIDAKGAPWLIAVTGQGAKISVRSRNRDRAFPNLFAEPLSASTIRQLSPNNNSVTVKENGNVVLDTPTTGIDRVIDYLTWVRGNTARTLRDARLWPRNGDIRIQDMTPEVLERYEVMQRRALAGLVIEGSGSKD